MLMGCGKIKYFKIFTNQYDPTLCEDVFDEIVAMQNMTLDELGVGLS